LRMRPRSSGDRAQPSEGWCAGSIPAGGTHNHSIEIDGDLNHLIHRNLLPYILV